MSHNIASVSQAAFLPQQTGPGISAVQSQPSLALKKTMLSSAGAHVQELKEVDVHSGRKKPTNPLYQLV